MVKIPLSVEQINALLKWRDEHKELVRACVVPFPECEIISENEMKIRARRVEEHPNVYSFMMSDTIQHEIVGRFEYMTMTGAVHHGAPRLHENDVQSAITVWATVMAYIVNFEPHFVEKPKANAEAKGTEPRSTSPHKQKRAENSVLYLNPIKFIGESKNAPQRKYKPPSCAFSVRGHYRHLKSGKVVYVHPYEKNTGKEKDKRNKVVKIMEV